MGSVSKPEPYSGDENAENGTVPHLISQLKSAFQSIDFDKVEQILTIREEDMKREIAHWKKEYELMEKNHQKMELTKLEVEDELNKHKRECCTLREQVTRLEEDHRVQIARLEEDHRVEIARFKEDQRVHCDRKKASEERYAKLLNDYANAQTENKKLNVRISALDFAKNKAEKRFEELDLRVLRLEDETAILMSGSPTIQRKKEESEAEKPVSDNGRSRYATGVGTGSANLPHPQGKERASSCFENVPFSAGGGSASDTMVAGSNHQEAGFIIRKSFLLHSDSSVYLC
ncbi:hypothetical protein U1Q18_021165 [Sarracenia purpurea var. burkii]